MLMWKISSEAMMLAAYDDATVPCQAPKSSADLNAALSNTSTASTAVSVRRTEAARQAVCMSGNIMNDDACTQRQQVMQTACLSEESTWFRTHGFIHKLE